MSSKLASAASERKQRLIALRNRKQAAEEGAPESSSTLVFKQRNYDPETRQARKRTRDDDGEAQDTVEATVQGLTQQIIVEDEAKRAEELDLLNIAPKRANWDLKRDMTLRMAKVERKTNESIATLFRQRLQAMKRAANPDEQVDLVASMNAAAKEMQAETSASDSD